MTAVIQSVMYHIGTRSVGLRSGFTFPLRAVNFRPITYLIESTPLVSKWNPLTKIVLTALDPEGASE